MMTFLKSISLSEDLSLIPYRGREVDQEALFQLFNDDTVYPHISDGQPWSKEKVSECHQFLQILNEKIKAEGLRALWDRRELISLCWQLNLNGEIIGCGGLFWDPEDQYIPEIYLYILQPYQSLGLGTKFFKEMISYFKNNIFPLNLQPLRILVQDGHEVSLHLARKFGFSPIIDDNGQQVRTLQHGLSYLVFEQVF
jgi:RimJ/RimL family protein N-acetyltransferase